MRASNCGSPVPHLDGKGPEEGVVTRTRKEEVVCEGTGDIGGGLSRSDDVNPTGREDILVG